MIETVLRCHATDRRQPIKEKGELPDGWVAIPAMTAGTRGEPRELKDLHFASFEVLAEWSRSQHVMRSVTLKSA